MTILESIKVAAVQMVSTSNMQENLDQARYWIGRAVAEGAQLVLLPEYFCLMGLRDTDKLAVREPMGEGPLQAFLRESAREHGIWLIGGTIPLESGEPDRIYNSCLVFDPEGQCVARYDKIHLFDFDNGTEVFSESNTIVPGSNAPQVFRAPFGDVGLSICYDLRFPELYRALNEAGLIVVPSAFTWTTGEAHWEVLLRARAIENQCYVLAAAQGGRHDSGRRTWGRSVLIDPWGEVLDSVAQGPGLVTGQLDSEHLAAVRQRLPALRHRRL
ncbi:MAG: carbon-nitrogen hydrolase family protein [Castellaniella sp.]